MLKKQGYKGPLMFPIKLQLFAEGGDGGDEPEGEPGGDESTPETPKALTIEDVQKLLAKERESWQQQMMDERTEAEKLASMSEKDKKKYQDEKRGKELDDREAAITRRELTAQAKVQLADKGLPVSLAEILNFTDAESCNESIETVSKAFQEAVEKAVEDRIKGGKPLKKVHASNGITLDSIKNMSTEEINANWDEVQAVLKNK